MDSTSGGGNDTPRSNANFNPLPGVDVKVPLMDPNGWPQGGVRFPDVDPLGKPMLIAQGFMLPEDEVAMLGYASYLWDNLDNYIARSRSASSQ